MERLNRMFWEITLEHLPRLWLRYVNDTFIIINKRDLNNFFKYINDVVPNIKFTQEECVDNKLAFLDCHVHLKPDRSLNNDFTVDRKPTHTDNYLQVDSHHPLIHKLGVIRTLHYRAYTIISNPLEMTMMFSHSLTTMMCLLTKGWYGFRLILFSCSLKHIIGLRTKGI